ncbi:MAG: ABC transporter permease, partial [Gemmatimonadota bacterium]
MKPSFVLRHAVREGRSSLRRIGVYMASIALGVAALVAVHSFRADVERSIRMESRSLLGADLRFERNQPYEEPVLALVDSLESAGATVSRVTTFMSMVYAPGSDLSRLVQIRAVEGGYPLYGDIRTDPPGVWRRGPEVLDPAVGAPEGGVVDPEGATEPRGANDSGSVTESGIQPGHAVVDPAVLVQLDVEPGDTLRIGEGDFVVAGSVEGLPTDLGFQTAVGPRIFIADESLEGTGLLTFGSLARYQTFFRFDDGQTGRAVQERYEDELRAQLVDSDTAGELAGDLTEGLEVLSRFLGLVGLVALLLGGVGVASAIHVYVKERLDSVAVLRCIGATEGDVFRAYLLQTGALGLLGSGVGVLLGIGVQLLLPTFLEGILPVTVEPVFHPGPVVAGLVAGVWIAGVFALIPLLDLRQATPLQALRRDFEESGGTDGPFGGLRAGAVAGLRDPLRAGAYGALAASVVAVSVWQAPTVEVGLGFAASLAGCLALLLLCARGLMWAVR